MTAAEQVAAPQGRGITILDQGGLAQALRRDAAHAQLMGAHWPMSFHADVLVTLLDCHDLLTEPARAHHSPEVQVTATLFAVADFQRLCAERQGDTARENVWRLVAQDMGTMLRGYAESPTGAYGIDTQGLAVLVRDIDMIVHRLIDGGDGTRTATDGD